MKPLSICIIYCASLYACFKSVKVFDSVSAFFAVCLIAGVGLAVIREISQAEK